MKVIFVLAIFITGCISTPVRVENLPEQKLIDNPQQLELQKRSINTLITDADKCYLKHTVSSLHKSIHLAQEVIKKDAHYSGAYWRTSRAYHSLYDLIDNDEKKDLYALEGIKYAQQGMQANSKSPECLYYQAVCLGLYSQLHPITSLGRIRQMIESGKQAVEIDGSIFYGGPHRLLGYIYLQAPESLGFGDLDLALEHFEQALEIAPNHAGNLVAMAQAHIEDDSLEEAKKLLKEVLSRENFDDIPHALEQSKKEAKKLLSSL
ncbi:TRAP transporter TatT component family protein [Candidatus Uabimicrobium sp. HlEnr_7]|uniref:TRAP transporter TatT component family protein n=1 Tax=Candidatus Uabimicrobium helgolandensis TaxID=3095367 RepID=UPI003556A8C6